MLCHFCKTTKTPKRLAYSSLIYPDGWVSIKSPENEMQTQSLYMSFLTRHNVRSCLCMSFPFTSSLLHYWWSVCVQHRCFSLSSACFIFQVASKSICFHTSLFLPSPNTFLCYINNLHLPPQIRGTRDFHRCRFLFQPVCLW